MYMYSVCICCSIVLFKSSCEVLTPVSYSFTRRIDLPSVSYLSILGFHIGDFLLKKIPTRKVAVIKPRAHR